MPVTRVFLVTIFNAYYYWYYPLCDLTTKQEYVQPQNDIKIVRTLKLFVQKTFFHQFFRFFQSQSWLWESTAAIFRQSAGYVCYTLLDIGIGKETSTH